MDEPNLAECAGPAGCRRSGDVESGEWGLIVDPRGWALVIRGNPANAAEGLGGVGPGDPVADDGPRLVLQRKRSDRLEPVTAVRPALSPVAGQG